MSGNHMSMFAIQPSGSGVSGQTRAFTNSACSARLSVVRRWATRSAEVKIYDFQDQNMDLLAPCWHSSQVTALEVAAEA